MGTLLDFAISSHGGLDRWNELTTVTAVASVEGALWILKRQHNVLVDVEVKADCHRQRTGCTPFTAATNRSVFEPDHVKIETLEGTVLDEREKPREAFRGHARETPWDDLHLAYFSGYAAWNYLTVPFALRMPGFQVEEVEPWNEGGEQWRRLKVRFPPSIATHSPEQVFYFGSDDGLLRRLDYYAEVTGSDEGVAHYAYSYRDFGGIMLPTRRCAYRRAPDGHYDPKPLLVGIDFASVEVE